MISVNDLKGNRNLSQLTDHDLEVLAGQLEEIHVNPGTVLIHEGQHASGAFLVVEGTVEAEKVLAGENERVLVSNVPHGEWVGVVSLLDKKPATASVKAITSSRVLTISQDSFNRIIGSGRPTGVRFHRSLLRSVAVQLSRVNTNVVGLRDAAKNR